MESASKEFKKFLQTQKKEKNISLFIDIETLQYNQAEGRKKPTKYKNVTYSVACSFFKENDLLIVKYSNFKDFFDIIISAFTKPSGKVSCKPLITLYAHNTNKYDNHFLLHDLLYFYPFMQQKNIFLKNAINQDFMTKVKDIHNEEKKGLILEKRVKSSNNLELDFYLENIHFKTCDTWLKTNVSLAVLGKKLLRLGILNESQLKTSFDYEKYNVDENLTDKQAYFYAKQVFKKLDKDEHIYIDNDVIILAYAVKYYSKIFKGFDFSKMTFTSNILESYNTNPLTQFQLLNTFGEKEDTQKVVYTDFTFNKENFYDFLKSFYRGGLNFLNYEYVSKILKDAFSMDRNSSYPDVMYHYDIPTFLVSAKYYSESESIIVLNNKKFYLYRMTKNDFNAEILAKIQSRVFRQMLVKYYTTNEYVNITSYTIKLINEICGINIKILSVLAVLEYECIEFGNKEMIAENYYIKSQGKLKNKIIMENPVDYIITEMINSEVYSQEEIDNAKVLLNGLYGIPALRPFFHLFVLLPDGNLNSIPNGFKNTERNIVFSIFVTSVAFYALLMPLKYLTEKEIDDNFIYCDTDSLYLKKAVYDKMPKELFDPISLGKWDIEHDNIEKIFVLNHKKYAYSTPEGITVKCGGIPLDSFNTDMDFEKFIDTQFHKGIEVHTKRSIYNEQRTISIYPSKTLLDEGQPYPLSFIKALEDKQVRLLDKIRKENPFGLEDTIYIESALGTFSNSDIFPVVNETKDKMNIDVLIYINLKMKARLGL